VVAAEIDGHGAELARARDRVAALESENQRLRTRLATLQGVEDGDRAEDRVRLAEIALPAGPFAPGAARIVVEHCLVGLVAEPIVRDAQLLISELVSNSVRHGDLGDGDAVRVRVHLDPNTLRLEVENPGTAGTVEQRPPEAEEGGGGFGLELVDILATRWDVVRTHTTNVWCELGR
jgi:anti-sigma regulatory factor (Ser/Thr protein kinase)